MRRVPFALVLVVLAPALAGCSGLDGASPCQDIATTQVVDEVTGSDILVADGSLVLHASGARIHVRDLEGCHVGTIADVRPGDRVGHDATEIAASYPGQAWPDTIVVERVGPNP